MKKLTRRQLAVLPYLVSGLSQQEAARRSGVSDASISRYLTDPDFCDALDKALNQQLKDAVTKATGANLSGMLPETIDTVREIIKNPRTKVRAKLAGIKLLWDITFKLEHLKAKVQK